MTSDGKRGGEAGASRASGARKKPRTSRGSKSASASGATGGPRTSSKLYYRIGEVSRITGIKPYVLRYWESEFKWMAPQKSRSKQRVYRPKDIDTILLIKKLLYEERYTIEGARRYLAELGSAKARGAKARAAAHSSEGDVVGQLSLIRRELEEIRDAL